MTKPPVSSVARMESEEAGPDLVAVWEVHLADGVHVIGKTRSTRPIDAKL